MMAGVLEAGRPAFLLALCVAGLAVYKHKDNIKRLLAKTEPRFGDPVEADSILPEGEAPEDER